jgi:hypothetical protein
MKGSPASATAAGVGPSNGKHKPPELALFAGRHVRQVHDACA